MPATSRDVQSHNWQMNGTAVHHCQSTTAHDNRQQDAQYACTRLAHAVALGSHFVALISQATVLCPMTMQIV